jgi:hypothetical protein
MYRAFLLVVIIFGSKIGSNSRGFSINFKLLHLFTDVAISKNLKGVLYI